MAVGKQTAQLKAAHRANSARELSANKVPEISVNNDDPKDRKMVGYLFLCILLCQMMLNFDSGAIPSVLNKIKAEFNMEPVDEGLMGSLQYVGLTLGSPIAGLILQKKTIKWMLLLSLFLNAVCCFAFALSPAGFKGILLAARFAIGFSQVRRVGGGGRAGGTC